MGLEQDNNTNSPKQTIIPWIYLISILSVFLYTLFPSQKEPVSFSNIDNLFTKPEGETLEEFIPISNGPVTFVFSTLSGSIANIKLHNVNGISSSHKVTPLIINSPEDLSIIYQNREDQLTDATLIVNIETGPICHYEVSEITKDGITFVYKTGEHQIIKKYLLDPLNPYAIQLRIETVGFNIDTLWISSGVPTALSQTYKDTIFTRTYDPITENGFMGNTIAVKDSGWINNKIMNVHPYSGWISNQNESIALVLDIEQPSTTDRNILHRMYFDVPQKNIVHQKSTSFFTYWLNKINIMKYLWTHKTSTKIPKVNVLSPIRQAKTHWYLMGIPLSHNLISAIDDVKNAQNGDAANYKSIKTTKGFFAFILHPIITFISYLVFLLFNYTNNWVISISLVAVLIRLILTPVIYVSLIHKHRMKKAQPELTKIQKLFGYTSAAGEKILEIYKQHKVNPWLALLATIIQLPLIVSVLNSLATIFEMKWIPLVTSSGFLNSWIPDLSQPDMIHLAYGSWHISFSILPSFMILSVITTMYITGDLGQQFHINPIYITIPAMLLSIIFIKTPAIVSIFFCISGILSLIQHALINRLVVKQEENQKQSQPPIQAV